MLIYTPVNSYKLRVHSKTTYSTERVPANVPIINSDYY